MLTQCKLEGFPKMNIVTEVNDWITIRKKIMYKTVGFVPTMGNLHAGHRSLCERSKCENDITVVSIFVNPTQFNNQNDLTHYPRTLAEDIEKLTKSKVDYLFAPAAETMYQDNYEIQLVETELSKELEGEHRPGHFNGMLTVVLKLLNLIQADKAYFGEKDYQQLLLVKKMVSSLFIPTEIIACETIRNEDGLALSSRNSRLSQEQLNIAAHFPHLLQSQLTDEEVILQLIKLGFKVDYIVKKWQRRLGAVHLENVRLIDNIHYN